MKYSIYNSIIPITEDRVLLYNSYKNNYIIISSNIYNIYKSINESKESYISLYEQLINAGFIIKNHIDEIELLKQRIHDIDDSEDSFKITINPTINCNFSCWYCYETHSNTIMNDHVLSNVKKLISHVITSPKLKTFELSFFGGEPLLFYEQIVTPILFLTNYLMGLYP